MQDLLNTGNTIDRRGFRERDFSAAIPLLAGQHFEVPPRETWIITARFLELAHKAPIGARMRLVNAADEELVGWAPLCAIAFAYDDGPLVRRLERIEAAFDLDLDVSRALGSLRRSFTLHGGTEFWPEFENCEFGSSNIDPRCLSGALYVAGVKVVAPP